MICKAEKGLPAPTPKSKKKFPFTGQTTKKGNNLNPKVVIKPIDHNQGQNALNTLNQPAHLPDQPPNIPNPAPPPPIPTTFNESAEPAKPTKSS